MRLIRQESDYTSPLMAVVPILSDIIPCSYNKYFVISFKKGSEAQMLGEVPLYMRGTLSHGVLLVANEMSPPRHNLSGGKGGGYFL